jgi:hypothetical protein
MTTSLDEAGQVTSSECSKEPADKQPQCVTCGSTQHETSDCPDYSDTDRQMMLLGAELFVNACTSLGDYGQNCLNEFADALQPNEAVEEPVCAYCRLPMGPDQMCSSPIGDVHEDCYAMFEETQDEQF